MEKKKVIKPEVKPDPLEFPPRRNPPWEKPEPIDWEKATELIKQYAAENREEIIRLCRGDYEGVDDGYYD